MGFGVRLCIPVALGKALAFGCLTCDACERGLDRGGAGLKLIGGCVLLSYLPSNNLAFVLSIRSFVTASAS